MAFLYVDDSKHHHLGFSLAAMIICGFDPRKVIEDLFRQHGYDPKVFEFKSSTKMSGDLRLQGLRSALKGFIGQHCSLAVCVVGDDRHLGSASLKLLASALRHPALKKGRNRIWFDEGMFLSTRDAVILAKSSGLADECDLCFELDSRTVPGIQVADLAAHTCATMLSATLGHMTKKVILDAPGDSSYDGAEVELSFELWAGIRYCFLSQNKADPKDDLDLAMVDVEPWGLFIDESASRAVASAARDRFAEMYLGCVH